jgi:hypothetical protein
MTYTGTAVNTAALFMYQSQRLFYCSPLYFAGFPQYLLKDEKEYGRISRAGGPYRYSFPGRRIKGLASDRISEDNALTDIHGFAA